MRPSSFAASILLHVPLLLVAAASVPTEAAPPEIEITFERSAVVEANPAPEVAVPVSAPAHTPAAEPEAVADPVAEPEPEPEAIAEPPAEPLPVSAPVSTVPTPSAAPVAVPVAPTPIVAAPAVEAPPRGEDSSLRRGYEARLLALLDAKKRYPDAARRFGIEGRVRVSFRILPDGALRDPHLLDSSGDALLDRAAIELLSRAAPFPAPPFDVPVGGAAFVLPIHYRLRS